MGSPFWATLFYEDDNDSDSLQQVLDTWFFTSTPEEQARGDMACIDDVDIYRQCVRWVRVPDDDTEAILDPLDLHPTHDAFIFFYRLSESFQEVHVLGVLPYQVVCTRLRGMVSIDVDLSMSYGTRLRGFAAPFHLTTPVPTGPAPETWLFHFPFGVSDCMQSPSNIERMCHYVNPDAFTVYRTFLAASTTLATVRPPYLGQTGSALERAYRESGCSMLCAMLAEYLEFFHVGKFNQVVEAEARRQRVRYDEKRMDTERILFEWRMKTYGSISQRALLKLMRFNHMLHNHVTPTTRDVQVYWEMYPEATYEPSVFFSMSLDYVDAGTLMRMPKYENGKVHLPCYWKPLCSWLWNYHVAASQQRFTLYRKADMDAALSKNPLIRDWLHEQFCNLSLTKLVPNEFHSASIKRRYNIHSATTSATPTSGTNSTTKRRRGIKRQCAHNDGVVVAIEDMGQLHAPCMRPLIDNNRHAKNQERLRGTQIFYGADFHIMSIVNYFDDMNERYPEKVKSGPVRFSVIGAIEAVHDATYCGNLVKNVLEQVPDALYCPYVKDVNITPTMESTDITRACRGMCGVRGDGPHDWVRNKWKERGMKLESNNNSTVSAVTEPTLPQDFNPNDDEEDEEEEEEAEEDEPHMMDEDD